MKQGVKRLIKKMTTIICCFHWELRDKMLSSRCIYILHYIMCLMKRPASPAPLSCKQVSLSNCVMIKSPVTNETVYLWNFPSRCFCTFHNFPSLLFAPVPTCSKRLQAQTSQQAVQRTTVCKRKKQTIKYIVLVPFFGNRRIEIKETITTFWYILFDVKWV